MPQSIVRLQQRCPLSLDRKAGRECQCTLPCKVIISKHIGHKGELQRQLIAAGSLIASSSRAGCWLKVHHSRKKSRDLRLRCSSMVDCSIMVKISLAQTSNQLDLSECELTSIPEEVFTLTQLEELSLAGNDLRDLPDNLSQLTSLRKLQLSGNRLKGLPESICSIPNLEGLWIDGNLLKTLPSALGSLSALQKLSVNGNHLEELPESVGQLQELKMLMLAGNRLHTLPASLGNLSNLKEMTLNGNALTSLPDTISGLKSLKALTLQHNKLTELPSTVSSLTALEEIILADNEVSALPESDWDQLKLLKICMLYGNRLSAIPVGLLEAPILKEIWAEDNPLSAAAAAALARGVKALPAARGFVLGLDSEQVEGVDRGLIAGAGRRVQVGEVVGSGRGYFKLRRGPPGDVIDENGDEGVRVLVVAFASAPGVPNWGGLLERIRRAAEEPAHARFDVLYVVDAGRCWYSGGDDEGFQYWWDRLARVTGRYSRVLMLGDSMGATAALMFSPLATAVQAFTPQVDFMTASLRPGRDSGWLKRLTERVVSNVAASEAKITTHSSSWMHDLDQARLVPVEDAQLKVYSVSTHRLAFYLDGSNKLLPLVRGALLEEMGFPSGNIRLQNLV